MRISKRQQGAETSVPLQDQDREKIHSSGLRPTLSTAILPNCISERRKSLSGQSDVLSHGKLVFAVRNVTDSEESVSDEMLLKSVAEGDKAAMHIIFARHRVRVFRFIQRMVRNTAIADDLVSQVFLDVWRSANSFESRSRVFTWLLSIARFKALSSLRQRTYENIDQDDVVGIVDAADTPEVALDRKETNAILRACIDKLSPAHREIIDLVYYHEQSIAEASVIVGIPHATVKSRMFYARKQLARILLSAGFEAAAVRTSADTAREARPSRGSHLKLRAGPSPISNPLENTIGTKWTYQGLRRMSDV
jgi:RNA polymerase sigma-70 factor (ECF subfamily)